MVWCSYHGRAFGPAVAPVGDPGHAWPLTRANGFASALARKVFGPFGRKVPSEQPGRLAHFDQVAVWVAHVAAKLGSAIDRRSQELGTPSTPLPITGVDIGDPEVQE